MNSRGCLRSSRHTFDAAYTWVEVADWLPFVITGGKDVSDMRRCVCAAAHKALFNPEWGGYPSKEFIEKLDPALIKVLGIEDAVAAVRRDPGDGAGVELLLGLPVLPPVPGVVPGEVPVGGDLLRQRVQCAHR